MKQVGLTKGSAPIKAIIAVAILAAVIYAAIVLIPIYADHYSLEDTLKEDIKFAKQNIKGKNETEMQKTFTNMIKGYLEDIEAEFDIKNIVVKVDTGKKEITVKGSYRRPHNVPFFPKEFKLDISERYGMD